MPIVESSEYEYSREEEERQFLRSLESPGLEMTSMQPSRPHGGKSGVQNVKRATAGVELSSIGDEQPPSAFGSKFNASRSSLPTFDTPVSSARQSLDLNLSDLDDEDYDSVLGSSATPASTGHLKHHLKHADDTSDSSAWTARATSRNLIELEESGSSVAGSSPAIATADLKGRLQQSRTQFERSIHNAKEQPSPSSKILAKEAPELLVQPRRLYQNTHESNPIISSHLSFPEKQRGNGPHTGTFKAPASRKGRDLDEAIRNVEGQLRAMEGELLQKKSELERLRKEKLAGRSPVVTFFKRLFFALFFLGLLFLTDLLLRVVITQQQFNLGQHVDLDQVTAFYKNYLDLAMATLQDLRAKGTIPF